MSENSSNREPVTPESLQYLWSLVASNSRQMAEVADDLAAAALAKAGPKRFDELFERQDKLFATASKLQQALEEAHVEFGVRAPTQNYR